MPSGSAPKSAFTRTSEQKRAEIHSIANALIQYKKSGGPMKATGTDWSDVFSGVSANPTRAAGAD